MKILSERRLQAVKQAFSTRRVPKHAICGVVNSPARKPQAGDIVLARVETVGRLSRVELPSGRKSALYEGDELLLVYGDRYAPDAYEAFVPEDLGPCDLAAAGGLAANVVETNLKFAGEERPPTRLVPVGLCVGEEGEPLNLSEFALRPTPFAIPEVPVICVFGASMNAGKTTTAAGIIRGLTCQGFRVGATKITGTCAGGDLWKFRDAGAVETFDFTDTGLATTYRAPIQAIRDCARDTIASLEEKGCEAVVVEIADGLYQGETAALLRDVALRSIVTHWVFAADSAASIMVGMQRAAELNIPIAGVSGSVTASQLAMREAADIVIAPICDLEELQAGETVAEWLKQLPIYTGNEAEQSGSRKLIAA